MRWNEFLSIVKPTIGMPEMIFSFFCVWLVEMMFVLAFRLLSSALEAFRCHQKSVFWREKSKATTLGWKSLSIQRKLCWMWANLLKWNVVYIISWFLMFMLYFLITNRFTLQFLAFSYEFLLAQFHFASWFHGFVALISNWVRSTWMEILWQTEQKPTWA